MRDLYNDIGLVQSLAPAARIASANGTGVDLKDYEGAVVLFEVGARTDGTHTFEVQDSADNVTFAAVADSFLQGTEPVVAAAGDANKVYKIGYLGSKRYLRAAVTVAGATTGAVYGANVIRGHAATKPVA